MKIVTIFAEKLYAFQYQGEAEDEYSRLMNLWLDNEYLLQYAQQNNIADIRGFVDIIIDAAEYIDDLMSKIAKSNSHFEDFFMPLDNLETRVKVLSLQKGKTKREKFLELVSDIDIKAEEKINWRIANRKWLRVSQGIGFDILEKLDNLGWTQKVLAEKMGVSPQYVNKLVKGGENLTLETLVKLQDILDIPLLASYFKTKQNTSELVALPYSEEKHEYAVASL